MFCLFPIPGFPLNTAVRWKKVALVGVGLLGGSLGLAIRQRGLAERVVGFVRRPASLAECERAGTVDQALLDLQAAVAGADLVVLCTPIAQMAALSKQMLPALRAGTVVTDVGSVKGGLVLNLDRILARAGANFVGSHPMAGSEKTGVGAAKADLFAGTICIVTPTPHTRPTALRRVERLWREVGARTLRLRPAEHDRLVSRSSHLPHVVAAALANVVLGPGHSQTQAMLCANGFRDTTRVASGSTEMWRDIALANRRNLRGALAAMVRGLRDFDRALANGDAAAIEKLFCQAKQRRDAWRAATSGVTPE